MKGKRDSVEYVHSVEFDGQVEDVIREIRAEMVRVCAIPEELLRDLPKHPSYHDALRWMEML